MKLRIEKAVYGGSGLAREMDGRTVFVPFTLPGEVVDAKPISAKSGFEEAALVEVLEPSADRVFPKCRHFGECGGCQYQHADYSAQTRMKLDILRETLVRAGVDLPLEALVHSGEPWGYRNRARFRVETAEGAVHVGYNRRGTNEFLPIQECPITSPLLWSAAEAMVRVGAEESKAGRFVQGVSEVELFADAEQKKLQVSVFTEKPQVGFKEFCARLGELAPEVVGAGVSVVPVQGANRRAQKPRQVESWGAEGLNYRVADESYWVSRGGFFQVNRFLLEELVRVVVEGREGALAWDLYAGVGLFSRRLARGFDQVVAVEIAGNDLVRSFKGPGKVAIESTTVDFLRRAVVQRERPGLIVMDPPRAGVGAEVCTLLNRIAASEMVYVSCDPVTLARDLKMMQEAGYRVVELHMVDLFPQTFHLETVAVLRK